MAILLIIASLCALIVPLVRSRNVSFPRMVCLSNLKQTVLGALVYETDWERLPRASTWADDERASLKNKNAFSCPWVSRKQGEFGHAYHKAMDRAQLSSIARPEFTVLQFDSVDLRWNANGPLTLLPPRGRTDGSNSVGFVDGHVKSLTRAALLQYIGL